MIKTVTLDA